MKRKIAMATLALIPLTATNVFASNQEGIVTATSLNVRSGPSTGHSIVFTAKKNDRVTILQSESGWYKISSKNGTEGWASSEYISTNLDNIDNSNKKIVKADKLNMRNGASTSYRIITKINNGTVVEVISESNGWSKIKHDGRMGYVSSEFLYDINNENKQQEIPQTQPESHEQENSPEVVPNVVNDTKSSTTKVVIATSLNVRSGPSTSYGTVGSLKKNEKVEVISESNGWSKINFKGKQAYVSSTYLKNNDGGSVTPDPDDKPDVGTTTTKVVTATSLNVRSGPSTSYGTVGSLKKNEKVEVISESNGWSKINFKGKQAYVSSSYLKNDDGGSVTPDPDDKPDVGTTTTKVVTATSLNVRSGPSTSYGTVGSLKKNEKVEVISESNGWSKINFKGKEAYVSSAYLKNDDGGSVTPDPDDKPDVGTTTTKVVTATSLNVRSGPSTSYGTVGSLKKNEKVEVISESNGWSKINFKGKEAYVSSAYLKNDDGGSVTPDPDDKPDVGTTTTKVVTATSLNVRSGPSTSNGIVGSLKKNEKVEVISESNGWSKINFKGKEAYVSSSYLKNDDGGSVTPDPEPDTNLKSVTATSLNVRSGPSTSHSVVGSLKQNEVVEVISESNGWSKIKFKGLDGYVSSTYLKDYDGDPTNPDGGGSGGDSSEIIDGATVNYKSVGYSLQEHVNRQVSKGSGNMIASSSGGFTQANKNDVQRFINPNNFKGSKKGMLQFLRLDSYKGGITASELNGYLNSLRPASSGTNVFYNQGQAFIDAAQKYNIDLVYLVSHSMLETGYGRSTLAQGQILTHYQGQPLPQPVKVYNFFGIGAFDGTANLSGAEAAYKNGWTTVEKTIEGSAKWISSNYIHNSKYSQNTLYKMRWSYDHLWHQYATDVNWSNAISGIMSKLIGMYDTNSNLVYEVPVHR